LQRLLDAAAAFKNPNSHLEANTLRALLLLLYGAGLRISEALSLTLADVDLPNSVLMIRESKFYKTRLAPIGPRLTTTLATHTIKRRQISRCHSAEAPFFVTRGGSSVKLWRRTPSVVCAIGPRSIVMTGHATSHDSTI